MSEALLLKRAALSRPSGVWNDDDYDVLCDGLAVGPIMKAMAHRRGRRGCGRWPLGIMRTARLRTATRRRARRRWPRSPRVGGGHESISRESNAYNIGNLCYRTDQPGRSMPIAPFLGDQKFDPETKRIMGVAFEMARAAIGCPSGADAIIAKRIIELAKAGERNTERLSEFALDTLRSQ